MRSTQSSPSAPTEPVVKDNAQVHFLDRSNIESYVDARLASRHVSIVTQSGLDTAEDRSLLRESLIQELRSVLGTSNVKPITDPAARIFIEAAAREYHANLRAAGVQDERPLAVLFDSTLAKGDNACRGLNRVVCINPEGVSKPVLVHEFGHAGGQIIYGIRNQSALIRQCNLVRGEDGKGMSGQVLEELASMAHATMDSLTQGTLKEIQRPMSISLSADAPSHQKEVWSAAFQIFDPSGAAAAMSEYGSGWLDRYIANRIHQNRGKFDFALRGYDIRSGYSEHTWAMDQLAREIYLDRPTYDGVLACRHTLIRMQAFGQVAPLLAMFERGLGRESVQFFGALNDLYQNRGTHKGYLSMILLNFYAQAAGLPPGLRTEVRSQLVAIARKELGPCTELLREYETTLARDHTT